MVLRGILYAVGGDDWKDPSSRSVERLNSGEWELLPGQLSAQAYTAGFVAL